MERLLALDEREARLAWGSVWGTRMHWLLKGHEIAELATIARTIGHSHVLAPEKRTPDRARLVVRRLMARAATRLRRAGKATGSVTLMVKGEAPSGEKPPKWSGGMRVQAAMDTVSLLECLDRLWQEMQTEFAPRRFLQVGVVLAELTDADEVQPGLFDAPATLAPMQTARRLALSRAMDQVNARFGRDAVTLGHDEVGAARSSGPRIAFTRIPELAEFHE